ncbi:hypothetical protein DXG03_006883 [Asterophora parasitica]|uniref:Uncharacterized protein n=1 Tax=Asterophora parasitica TaxID=117018 RepID=A0A9P7K9D3_9AGAR|nr:hypothetical protein DXG03_006883 [Asterophora parasitica]
MHVDLRGRLLCTPFNRSRKPDAYQTSRVAVHIREPAAAPQCSLPPPPNPLDTLPSKILCVIVIARNGDRYNYYQDPHTYAGSNTESSILGVAQSHQLGTHIRSTYLEPSSPFYVYGIRPDLIDNFKVKARVKTGVEGTVVFDSAVALLQGLPRHARTVSRPHSSSKPGTLPISMKTASSPTMT